MHSEQNDARIRLWMSSFHLSMVRRPTGSDEGNGMPDGDQWQVLTDAQWAVVEPLLPSSLGLQGRNFQNNRVIVEAMLYRMHTGTSWRALPPRFGRWKTAWKRHRRYVDDGTWDRILTALMPTDGLHSPAGAVAMAAGHARPVDTA